MHGNASSCGITNNMNRNFACKPWHACSKDLPLQIPRIRSSADAYYHNTRDTTSFAIICAGTGTPSENLSDRDVTSTTCGTIHSHYRPDGHCLRVLVSGKVFRKTNFEWAYEKAFLFPLFPRWRPYRTKLLFGMLKSIHMFNRREYQ